jgi:endonuclease/exonuclease/phosphatase (EEP) superfamily protein YafD
MAATIASVMCRFLAILCIFLTVLPLWRHKAWWVRVWDFPRQQLVLTGIVVGPGLVAVRGVPTWTETALLAALGLAMAYQLALVLPYTRLWPRQGIATSDPPGERSLRLMIANVLMSNRQVDRLAAIMDAVDPDVVLALETDAWWVQRLGAMLPEHPFRVLHPLDNTYGMALFSRLELVHPELRFLLKDDIPSIRSRVRLRSGEDVLLIGIHPEPPSPTEADSSLPRDA